MRSEHFQNPEAPRPLGWGRWNFACVFYASGDTSSRKRNFEFRPVRCAGRPELSPVGRDDPPRAGCLLIKWNCSPRHLAIHLVLVVFIVSVHGCRRKKRTNISLNLPIMRRRNYTDFCTLHTPPPSTQRNHRTSETRNTELKYTLSRWWQ